MSLTTATPRALDPFLRQVGASAAEVDAARQPASAHLPALARAGLVDAEIDQVLGAGAAPDVRASAEVIAAVAGECMPTGFGLWAHRVVEDYLARGGASAASQDALARLRRGDAVGATGMAQALKALAGVGELGITARPTDDGGYVLDGFVAWLSNLVDHALVVLPAATPDGGGIVVWTPLAADGLSPRPIDGLLALDATASGTLKIEGLRVPAEQVLTTDLAGFVRAIKPTFLILQTSFAAGLIRRSWSEVEASLDHGGNAVFAADARALGDRVAAFLDRWGELAAHTDTDDVTPFLELRLEASRLAMLVTRLELTLAGGRGYQTASSANRRFREAAFLPVQSPSEGQLLWELSTRG